MNGSDFFGAIPEAVRAHLPQPLQTFKFTRRSWLAQLYYVDPLLHYEAWNLGERRGVLEIGLHFESRDRDLNQRLLTGFQSHLFEIKAGLGESIEAEQWDKGWTKVYEVIPRQKYGDAYLDLVARRMAQLIAVMQPIFADVYFPARSARRRRR